MQNLNFKSKRRGIANIVAVLSLVLISVLAVGVVGVFIYRIVSVPQFGPQYSCLEMQTASFIEIKEACYNEDKKEIEVTVGRDIKNYE